jgi:hypothetical protein
MIWRGFRMSFRGAISGTSVVAQRDASGIGMPQVRSRRPARLNEAN